MSVDTGVLSIAADQYPPDYFQLLAIERSRSDVSQMEDTVRLQSTALKNLIGTDKERPAQVKLHSLVRAKACLLDQLAREGCEQTSAVLARTDSTSNNQSKRAWRPTSVATSVKNAVIGFPGRS